MYTNESIDIWYQTGLSLCNFDCNYCAAGVPEKNGFRTKTREWLLPKSKERFIKVANWLGKLPFKINLKVQTIGEPLVSRTFLRTIAGLTTKPNVNFVEIPTNGSLIEKRLGKTFSKYEANPEKLSLLLTWHPTEISAEAVIHQAIVAKAQGVNVNINTLLFPDTYDSSLEMARRCYDNGINFYVCYGYNVNDAYPGLPIVCIQDSEGTRNLLDKIEAFGFKHLVSDIGLLGLYSPKNLMCSAGSNYFYIAEDGGVHQCRPYSFRPLNTPLGSALDSSYTPHLRSDRFSKCAVSGGCICEDDYLHLEVAQTQTQNSNSLTARDCNEAADLPQSEKKKRLVKLKSSKIAKELCFAD